MRADVPSTRCTITYCPSLSACLPTVKPTVVHVGIYVNSIGPVSSIDMVSSGLCTHVTRSPDVSINRRNHGCSLEVGVVVVGGWGGSCFTAEESEARQWTGFPLSPVSAWMKPMSFKSRGGMDLCYGSSPLSGQAASFCSLGGRLLRRSLGSGVTKLYCPPVFVWKHVFTSVWSWNGGCQLDESAGHRSDT